MKVIQLSDPHLRPDGQRSFQVVETYAMFKTCVEHICSLSWIPDAIVITGDLADSGAIDSYATLKPLLDQLPAPVFVLPGNHDHRQRMMEFIPDYCPADMAISPHLCYCYDKLAMRLVMLDSTAPGSHSGHLLPEVATWLDQTLAVQAHVPTLLFTHHPPFLTGFGAMDEPYENANDLAAILAKYPEVRLCCGHIHRAITTQFAGRIAVTCPSMAMQIYLDLTAEGGDEFMMETTGYLVHHWHHGVCNSHVCQIPAVPTFSGPHKFIGSINP